MIRILKNLFLMISLMIWSIIWLLISSPLAMAGTSDTLSMNGVIFDGDGALDGSYSITFRLYEEETAGTAIHEDTQTVTVDNGVYSVVLGSETALPSLADIVNLYVGVTVEDDTEMTPRTPVHSVAFSQVALEALSLSSDITLTSSQIASGTITSSNISSTANISDAQISDAITIGASGSVSDSALSANISRLGQSIESADITDATIANADVSTTAAIAYSKLNLASSVVTGDITDSTIVSGDISDGTIANADVSTTAAIDGSKISPSFGSQQVNTSISGNPSSPANGDYWYNSSQKSHRFREPAGTVGLAGLLYASPSVQSGDTISNTTTETNFASNYAIPADALTVGKVIRVTARGVYSNTSTPTLNLKVLLGSTTLATTNNYTTASSVSNRGWSAHLDIIVVSTGASGTVEGQGHLFINSNAGTAANLDLENTATITIDTTASQTLQLSATWGTANASNTITMRQLIVTVLD